MFKERKAGVLVHPTSFPSDFGIGDLGKYAYEFIDFLKTAKQSYWQILPLNATTYSPYQAFSAFGRNYFIISPEKIHELQLITSKDLKRFSLPNDNKLDFTLAITNKLKILIKAFYNFRKQENSILQNGFDDFCVKNKDWLDDYSLFMALKYYFSKERATQINESELNEFIDKTKNVLSEEDAKEYFANAVWCTWEKGLVVKDSEKISYYKELLKDEIEFHKFCEFIFTLQWSELKDYANKNGIKIIGDLPIFVSYDSVDVWHNPELFCLNELGLPTEVAGVPPDYFCEDGQLWGNPLYNWENHKSSNYSWWLQRIKSTLTLVDGIRLDHFRGFESYWATRFGEETAKPGKWLKGPGRDFFSHIEHELCGLPFIAEDLGIITSDVDFLRDFFNLPGIAVIQFAFDGSEDNPYLPDNINENTAVYTGTHDNNTTLGWYNSLTRKEKSVVQRTIPFDESELPYNFIDLVYSTKANTTIIPLQDILELGDEARMNIPGTVEGNWNWRYTHEKLKLIYAERLSELVDKYKRN